MAERGGRLRLFRGGKNSYHTYRCLENKQIRKTDRDVRPDTHVPGIQHELPRVRNIATTATHVQMQKLPLLHGNRKLYEVASRFLMCR